MLARNKLSLLLVILSFVLFTNGTFAQLPQFNHVFNQPLLLNPAYIGTIESSRFIVNSRRQWPGFTTGREARFDTYSFSYDQFIPDYKIGFGIIIQHDQAGSSNLQSTNLGLAVAYELLISNSLRLRFGLQADYGTMNIDFSGLVFEDQIVLGNPVSQEPLVGTTGKASYIDFSFGSLLSSTNTWLGIAFHHLNEPNISLTDQKFILPTKFTVHGGVRLPARNSLPKFDVRFSTIYQIQGSTDQLSLGTNIKYNIISVNHLKPFSNNSKKNSHINHNTNKQLIWNSLELGLWYKGIDFNDHLKVNYREVDPFMFTLGLHFINIPISSIVYSYDFPFCCSSGVSTGGAHELTIRFQLGQFVDCPEDYNWQERASNQTPRGDFPIMDAR